MTRKKIHYTECGLDNVWILGAERTDQGLRIPAIESLHKEIGFEIIGRPGPLKGAEFRFLRKMISPNADQAKFAKLLGQTNETVSRWENDKMSMHPAVDRLVRLAFGREWSDPDDPISFEPICRACNKTFKEVQWVFGHNPECTSSDAWSPIYRGAQRIHVRWEDIDAAAVDLAEFETEMEQAHDEGLVHVWHNGVDPFYDAKFGPDERVLREKIERLFNAKPKVIV